MNVNLVPSWKSFLPAFKSPPFNTVKGVHYGVSLQWGPNTLIYNTTKVKPAPTSWGDIYSSKFKGKITVPNNPIQIADAALYLQKTKPSLGIKDPYELTKPQFDAVVSLLRQQKKLLLRYWLYPADNIKDYKTGDSVIGATWPYQTLSLQGCEGAGEGDHPEGRRYRLGGHLDAHEACAAPELRLQVDGVRGHPAGAGAAGARLRRDPGQPEGVFLHGQDLRRAPAPGTT